MIILLAKLVNGTLRYAPKKIYIEKQLVFNPTDEQLKVQGYKEVENTEAPSVLTKTQTAISSYVEQDEKIVQQWNIEASQPDLYDELQKLQREAVINQIKENDDKTLGIQCTALFDVWVRGDYKVGDVRTKPETGYPYECIQAHDSTVNTDWDISVRTLWKPWHSTSPDYALPYEAPTGAHDMYKAGEYMIYTDKIIYECIKDTNFSPTDYPQAWKAH